MCNQNLRSEKNNAIFNKKQLALNVSLDTRKFEIELYWKRAAYFWAFIAATFTGYFAVLSSNSSWQHKELILYILNCLGIFSSWIWYLELKGSKYWQENWEQHVSDKEFEIQGDVFNKVKVINENSIFTLNAHPYSVSKLNLILSMFIIFVWVLLFVYPSNKDFLKYIISVIPCISPDAFILSHKMGIFKAISVVSLLSFCLVSIKYGKSSFCKEIVIVKNDNNDQNHLEERKYTNQTYYNLKNGKYTN